MAKKKEWTQTDYYSGILDKIEKRYGEQSRNPYEDSFYNRMSTGVLSLDFMLGGGIPPGRWTTIMGPESSGKSTLLYTILASAIRKEVPNILLFDYETSAEPTYLKNITGLTDKEIFGVKKGVDVEKAGIEKAADTKEIWSVKPKIRYYTPSVGEFFFKTLHGLIQSLPDIVEYKGQYYQRYSKALKKRVGLPEKLISFKENDFTYTECTGPPLQVLALIDSYPEMSPEAAKEKPDSNPQALHARMFSSYIPLIRSSMSSKGVAIIGINHIRMKPMVMFGCFPYHQKIEMADGSTNSIGNIVSQRKRVLVKSYDEKEAKFVNKPITHWWDNGKTDTWLKIVYRYSDKGHNTITTVLTPGHECMTSEGILVPAGSLRIGDYFMAKTKQNFNSVQRQIIMGSLLGDGWVSPYAKIIKTHSSLFAFGHEKKQKQYFDWKASLFKEHISYCTNDKNFCTTELKLSRDPWFIKTALEYKYKVSTGSRQCRYSSNIVNQINALGLAIWLMDDGTAVTGGRNITRTQMDSYSTKEAKKIIKGLNKRLDLGIRLTNPGRNSVHLGDKFFAKVYKYVHESMLHKLPIKWRNKWQKQYHPKLVRPEHGLCLSQIIDIQQITKLQKRYNIGVQDTHNYILKGGVIVGNSPEYTPCGEHLKLAEDIRIRVANCAIPHAKGRIEEEISITGDLERFVYSKANTKKNKTFPKDKTTHFRICFESKGISGYGIDYVWDLFEYLKSTGQIKKRGNRIKIADSLPGPWCSTELTWDDLRLLIHKPISTVLLKKLMKSEDVSKIMKSKLSTRTKANKLRKVLDIKSACFEQINSKKSFSLAASVSTAKVETETDQL